MGENWGGGGKVVRGGEKQFSLRTDSQWVVRLPSYVSPKSSAASRVACDQEVERRKGSPVPLKFFVLSSLPELSSALSRNLFPEIEEIEEKL